MLTSISKVTHSHDFSLEKSVGLRNEDEKLNGNDKRKDHQRKSSIGAFPILYWISLISRLGWIQLESVKHDWRLLKTFLCLPLAVGSLV